MIWPKYKKLVIPNYDLLLLRRKLYTNKSDIFPIYLDFLYILCLQEIEPDAF